MHEAVIRWCEHGETVNGLDSTRGCSGCVAGICGAALACELPEPEPEPEPEPSRYLPTTEAWFAIAGAALGFAAAVYAAWPFFF